MTSAAAVRALDSRIGGDAFHRGEPGYAELAVSPFPNLEVPWRPEVVVRCADVEDVRAAVGFAAANGLGVAPRGGGVGWHGAAADTVLLDLSAIAGVEIDRERRIARVGGGAIWRDVSRELASFGLVGAAPQFPRLGVAGHVLGGGHGWLTGRLGWASDTLRAVELVTAAGELVRASATEEPDLFWALRGAGHNFGVAVALELELIELEEVSFGFVWFDPGRTAEALAFCRDRVVDAPDELTAIVSIAHPPEGVSPAGGGMPAVHAIVCHCGDAASAAGDLAPLREHPAAVADDLRRLPWAELAVGNDAFGAGVHRRSRMHYLAEFDDEVIAISERRARDLGPLDFMSTHYYGGALARVPEEATAMSHRDKPWNYMVSTTWAPEDESEGPALRRRQEEFLAEIATRAEDAYYVNYLFDEPEHVAAAYAPPTWRRLRELKQHWDPENRFHSNPNIPSG